MYNFNRTISGVVLVSTLTLTGVASATTYLVDGNISGTVQNGVYKKINDAIAAAQTGDTVLVGPANYPDSVEITKGIILQGSGPQFTKVNNTITVNTTEAVKITGLNISSQSNSGHGINVPSPSAQLDIINNCIVGNSGSGIYYAAVGTSTTPAHYLNITNNTISGNGIKGAYITGVNVGGLATVAITSNIFTGNGSNGLHIANSNGTTCVRNIFYGNNNSPSANQYFNVNPAPTPLSLVGVNPMFADETHGDFTLQVGSPARYAGTISASYLNPDGTQSDLGAFGGPGAATFWPYGYGPVVTSVTSDQQRVTQGASIVINATATVR
jgi:hypothetical protein